MFLYTQYGMIQGTVDEILEFIQKQRPNYITSGCNGTEFNEEKVMNKIYETIDDIRDMKIKKEIKDGRNIKR